MKISAFVVGLVMMINAAAAVGQSRQPVVGCFGGSGGRYVPMPAPEPDWEYCEGWYESKQQAGKLELYKRGILIGTLDPLNSTWQTAGKGHTVDLVQTFGLVGKKPSQGFEDSPLGLRGNQCCCELGKCRCAKCPNDCVARRSQGFEDSPLGLDPFPGGVLYTPTVGQSAYEISGRPATKAQVERILAGDRLEDDRAKPFLTAVLPVDERKRFLADVASHPALLPWKGKLHINTYDPANFNVGNVGLATGISYQAAPAAGEESSAVLFRFRTYTGPEELAQAIRKVDPAYKADSDPDPTKKKEEKEKVKDAKPPAAIDVNEDEAILGLSGVIVGNVGLWLRRRYGV